MAMQGEEERPDDGFPDGEEEGDNGGWYFDLPGGAWERQQEKNNELRRRIIENVEGRARDLPVESDQPRRGLFGMGRKKDSDSPAEAPGGAYRFARGDEAGARPIDPREERPPEPGTPPPLRIRRHDAERAPEYDEWSTEPSSISPSETATPGGPISRWDELFGASETDRAEPEPAAGGGPRGSREDEAPGEPTEGGFLEGMRSWARGTPPEDRDEPARGTWSEPETPAPETTITAPDAVAAEPPAMSRWESAFSAPADDGGMLEGMRRWARSGDVAPGAESLSEVATPPGDMGPQAGWQAEQEEPPALPQSRPAPSFEPSPIGPLPWEVEESYGQEQGNANDTVHDAESTGTIAPPGQGELAPDASKKPGLLGRIFGRRKGAPPDEATAGYPEPVAGPGGGWILPGEDDGRDTLPGAEIAAQPASDWLAPDEFMSDWTPPEGSEAAGEPQERVAEAAPEPEPAFAWEPPVVAEPEPEPAFAWEPPAVAEPEPEPAFSWEPPAVAEPEPEPAFAWEPPAVAEVAGLSSEGGWNPEPIVSSLEASHPVPAEAPASVQSHSGEPDREDDPWASFFDDREPERQDPGEPVEQPPAVPAWEWRGATSNPEPVGPASEAASTGGAEVDDDGGWGSMVPSFDAPEAAPDSIGTVPGFGARRLPGRGGPGAQQPIEQGDVARWLDSALDPGTTLEPDAATTWREAEKRDAPVASPLTATTPLTAGDWRVGDDDDVVLRAFEAHARTEIGDDHSPDGYETAAEQNVTFRDLLGSDGDDLVAEATEPDPEVRPFSRLQGWAPQRSVANETVTPWPAAAPGGVPDIDPVLADAADAGSTAFPFEPSMGAVVTPRAHRSRARTVVREAVETLLLAILVFLAVRASFQNFKVDGQSMYPTLDDGQFLIVNKLVYAEVDVEKLSNFIPFIDPGDDPKRNVFHAPERGDIIVLKDPRDPSQDLIKRIIALPGETVEIQDGKVYINDHYLEEPYIKTAWHDNKSKILIGQDEYFVMGDNRTNSLDSRSTQIGLVHKDLIIGKAMLSYWPAGSFGLAPNESGDLSSDVSLRDGRPVVTARRIGE